MLTFEGISNSRKSQRQTKKSFLPNSYLAKLRLFKTVNYSLRVFSKFWRVINGFDGAHHESTSSRKGSIHEILQLVNGLATVDFTIRPS